MISLQEQNYQATLENFTEVPRMPKSVAEARLVSLQEELNALDPQTENFAERQQTLGREILETQTNLNDGNVSEDPAEIQAFYDYNRGFHEYKIAIAQQEQAPSQ